MTAPASAATSADSSSLKSLPAERTSVAVYAGTYDRNEPLRNLLESVRSAALAASDSADVAMVVVDDNPDGSARQVVERFDRELGDAFSLGVHYRSVGEGNISLVRNAGLNAGTELAEWVAMTDDDCEVVEGWLVEFLDVLRITGADAVTGPCVSRLPKNSPKWLTEQPFLTDGSFEAEDHAEMGVAATNNSIIRSAWVVDHPDVRFDPELGVLGGEDMVFFGTANQNGLKIRYSTEAVVFANEPPERTTYRYRLGVGYWLGNTMCVTNLQMGTATRGRLLLRGAKLALRSVARPFVRMATKRSPEFRYAGALVAQAAGLATGALGVRRAHH